MISNNGYSVGVPRLCYITVRENFVNMLKNNRYYNLASRLDVITNTDSDDIKLAFLKVALKKCSGCFNRNINYNCEKIFFEQCLPVTLSNTVIKMKEILATMNMHNITICNFDNSLIKMVEIFEVLDTKRNSSRGYNLFFKSSGVVDRYDFVQFSHLIH